MLAPFNPANCPGYKRSISSPPGWRGAGGSRTQRATCAPHTSEPGRRRIGDRAGAAHRHPGHDQPDKARTTERIANPPTPKAGFFATRRALLGAGGSGAPSTAQHLPLLFLPALILAAVRPWYAPDALSTRPGTSLERGRVALMGGSSREFACASSSLSFDRARVRAGLSGVRLCRGRWSRCGCAVGDQDRRRGYRVSYGEGAPVSNETKGSRSK